MSQFVINSMDDFSQMCRCCATQSDELNPIVQCGNPYENIPNMLKECFNLVVDSSLLPVSICSTCYKKLHYSLQFKELCISSFTFLTDHLEQQNITIIKNEILDDDTDTYTFSYPNESMSDDIKPNIEFDCDEDFELKNLNEESHNLESGESEVDEMDSDVEAETEKVLSSLIPEKSKEKYEKTYECFKKWCKEKSLNKINEKVVVAYFSSKLSEMKSSTIWTTYSMLKSTLSIKDNVDISEFKNLKALLKRKTDGYQAKTSKVLTKEQIFRFIKEAPDEDFLAMKVALILGVCGACRRDEFLKMRLEDIEYMDNCIVVSLPNTKNKVIRQFVINRGDESDVSLIDIVRKYANLRPEGVPFTRFFVGYRKGKCTRQPIGINTFGGYPQKIAAFLNLPSASEYTGHCFKRSSASFLKDSVVNSSILKTYGDCESAKSVEGCAENLSKNKQKIEHQSLGTKNINITDQPSCSMATDTFSYPDESMSYDITPKIEFDCEEEFELNNLNKETQSLEAGEKMNQSEVDEMDSDLEAATEKALSSLLPEKSKEKYEKTYESFKKWCKEKSMNKINEKVVIAYFSSKLSEMKSSTFWTTYSMLRSTLSIKDNVDISEFKNLKAFLKQKSDGYQAKRSKVLTKEQIFRFIKEAPDEDFLVMKVALITGVYGACRRDEFLKMKTEDIEYTDNCIVVSLSNSKNKVIRQFVINRGDDSDVNLIDIVKQYANLRPHGVDFTRFFIGYRKGKCTRQPIGINTFGSYPQKIAAFLNLPSPSEYTGHCFKRSSASFLKDLGDNSSILKTYGNCESAKVAEVYIENLSKKTRKIEHQSLGVKKIKTEDQTSCSLAMLRSSIGPTQSNHSYNPPLDPLEPSTSNVFTKSSFSTNNTINTKNKFEEVFCKLEENESYSTNNTSNTFNTKNEFNEIFCELEENE